MAKKKPAHLHIKLETEVKNDLRNVAEKKEQTMGQYVRELLTNAIKRDKRKT